MMTMSSNRQSRSCVALAGALAGLLVGAALGIAQDSRPSATTTRGAGEDWNAVFGRIRNARRISGWGNTHFDMHGNPSADLLILLKAHFRPTKAICAELDRPDAKLDREDREALYYVLGHVKDPATIECLRDHLSQPDADLIYRHWLSGWLHTPIGPTALVKWVEQPERWSAFFTELLAKERDPERRVRLMHAMVDWLNDSKTLAYFQQQARDPQVKGEELMLVLLYLHIYGQPVDEERLTAAIHDVRATADKERLDLYVNVFPHRAFIPLLLERAEAAESGPAGTRAYVDYCLARITWQFGIHGAAAWKEWYAQHRSESQDQWIEGALSELERLVDSNPHEAAVILHDNPDIWTAGPASARIPKWVRHKEVVDALVSWPDSRLFVVNAEWWRRLHKQIVAANPERTEKEWDELLKPLNDTVHREDTWEEQFRWSRV
jgi:hypothetical protein